MTARNFNLDRFVTAQEPVYSEVSRELADGEKRSHWIWFIFPQIAGLGKSETAGYYAICSMAEAEAYFQHPILGTRLEECCRIVLKLEGKSAEEIFGCLDAMKFRSCLTLFAQTNPDPNIFLQGLEKYFGGTPDPITLSILRGKARRPNRDGSVTKD